MLRNRSRTATTKQAVMGDRIPTQSMSSLLGSPRFFNGFSSRTAFDAAVSPTSILDAKYSPNFVNPFRHDRNLPKPQIPFSENETLSKHWFNEPEAEAIGLALLLSATAEKKADSKSSGNRMVVFKEKLKVQIPLTNSPSDFGIKTRDSDHPFSPDHYFSRQLSLKEMELLEEYTCVIIHGPNRKTTHIFDDCIVENGCEDGAKLSRNGKKMETGNVSHSLPTSFLNFCHTCEASLGSGRDIYMYRGEKAFCSHECRFQEMHFEGMKKNPEMEG